MLRRMTPFRATCGRCGLLLALVLAGSVSAWAQVASERVGTRMVRFFASEDARHVAPPSLALIEPLPGLLD